MELHEEDSLKELLARFEDVAPKDTVFLPSEPPDDWLNVDIEHTHTFIEVNLRDVLQFIADMM